MKKHPKIGLALSGGAARGIAHIGILKVLKEHKYPIDYIAGTSMGAIIAGAYASGMNLGQLEEIARSIHWRDVTKVSFSRLGIMSGEPMEQLLKRLLPVTDFAKMKIPLAIVTADIQRGRPVVFTTGDAAHAMRISASVPGFFAPVKDEQGRLLVDGGIVQNLPIPQTYALGAERVIAINVNSDVESTVPPTNIFQMIMQSFMIIGRSNTYYQAAQADLLIEPKVGHIRFDELERADEMIKEGERVMREALPKALALLEPKVEEPLLQREIY